MIVREIEVENWGTLRDPIGVEFSEGLNILHGPNDIGKTTLIDAIRTVLFTKHTSRSHRLRSLVPWGSNLPPKAKVTFSIGPIGYRASKGFISSQGSLLEKLVDGKWERVAEGDVADFTVVELLGGRLPGRGDTRPELWGAGQSLWMVQGEPFITEGLNEETLSSLQRLIGAAIESDQEKLIFKEVSDRFLRDFTKIRRTIKKGSEIESLEEEIDRLLESRKELARTTREKEELIRMMDDTEAVLQRKRHKLKEFTDRKKELNESVSQAHDHKRHRERLEEETKRVASECALLRGQLDNIRDGRSKMKDLAQENQMRGERVAKHRASLEILGKEIDSQAEEMEEMDTKTQQLDTELKHVRIAYDAIQKARELDEKENLLDTVKELESELRLKQEELDGLRAPSREELARLERTYQRLHDMETKLDATGLTTRMSAQSNISGTISLDEETSELELRKGKEGKWTSHQSVRVRIDKVGEIEMRSGSEDVKELAVQREEAEIEYEGLVAPYPSRDTRKLRELSERKQELNRDAKRLRRELRKQAKEGMEAIEKEVAVLSKGVESNWERIPHDTRLKEYAEFEDKSLARSELSRRIRDVEEKIKDMRKREKEVRDLYSGLENQRESTRDDIQDLDKEIHANGGRIEGIKVGIERLQEDGLSLDDRDRKLNEKSVELDKKERALEEYRQEIEEIEEKPLQAWREWETTVDRLEKGVKALEMEMATNNVKLEGILDGLKGLAKIEEELENLEGKKNRLLTDAFAIALLYDLMSFYREKTIESLTAPVQKIMTEDTAFLYGEKYAKVRFDDGMKPVSVEVPDWEVTAPLDNLSFGTKEQMWYLFRLALGRLLSSEERQLVVLDDPLANTDPSRFHRALQILRERATELQIIVLTCDVDKYLGLTDANFISLGV